VIAGQRYYVLDSARGFVQQGLASWYGRDFHGRPTASGEIYDMYAPTAAHKTLPLGSYLRVTNLTNGRSMVVRVNDRGPFVKGRIVDLSYAAARELGMLETGVAPVRIEALGRSTAGGYNFQQGNFTIQVGAFKQQANARRLAGRLNNSHITLYDSPRGRFYRVRVGRYSNLTEAVKGRRKLEEEGFYDAFVVAE
jgi:rare lipoprotein A